MEKYIQALERLGFRVVDGHSRLGLALDSGIAVTAQDQHGMAYKLTAEKGELRVEGRGRRIERTSYIPLHRESDDAIPS